MHLKIIIAFFVLLFIVSSCAAPSKKPPLKRIPPKGPPATAPAPQAPAPPPELRRTNASPSTADVMTPKRQASMRLVDRGKGMLDAGNTEQATARFRDAINVDASNGVAYYYLAEADAKMGQPEVAAGLLDKAEALLGADQEWMGKIDELRRELGAPASKYLTPSPIDQAF